MIRTTVQKALDHNVEGYTDSNGLLTGHKLYLVRDGDIVFYIGKSVSPLTRLEEHMGTTWRGGLSQLGRLIQENDPESLQWTYELWKIKECDEYVKSYRKEIHPTLWHTFPDDFDLDEAEEALIKHFKPCLNSACNPNATPLPDRYSKGMRRGHNPYAEKLAQMYGMTAKNEEE